VVALSTEGVLQQSKSGVGSLRSFSQSRNLQIAEIDGQKE
jgi:hypothetical protein